jgi:hypothetical protein
VRSEVSEKNFGFSMVRHGSPQVLDFGLKEPNKGTKYLGRFLDSKSDNLKPLLSEPDGSQIQKSECERAG